MTGVLKLAQKARNKYLPKLLRRTLRQRPRADFERVGSTYGGWRVPTRLIDANSIVYCVGCGEDISFDLGLIERFGCHVWGLDPTPRSIAYVQSQLAAHPTLADRYHFGPFGLWSRDERTTFYLPDNPSHVSGSVVGLAGTKNAIDVELCRLPTLMAQHGHDRVDLLKMDIEGAEYEVLEDLLRGTVRPKWLGVEFDQPTPVRKTLAMIRRLREHGYHVADVDGWNYGFVHESAPA